VHPEKVDAIDLDPPARPAAAEPAAPADHVH